MWDFKKNFTRHAEEEALLTLSERPPEGEGRGSVSERVEARVRYQSGAP
jgi:hypothetical protein